MCQTKKKCPPPPPPDSFTENYFSFSGDSYSDVVGTPMIENLVEGMGLQLDPECYILCGPNVYSVPELPVVCVVIHCFL